MATLIGFISGILGGMGVGGGIILIPMLTVFLNTDQKIAQSTNLISFLPLALASLSVHVKHKNIDINVIKRVLPFGIIGAVVGSTLAVFLPSQFLKKIFSIFLLVMGLWEIFKKS